MYDDSIGAAEAITFWMETEIKKGRKYDRRVAVALWPEGKKSGPIQELSEHQGNSEIKVLRDEIVIADSVPTPTH